MYTLIGERKTLTPEKLNGHVVPQVNGKYKDFSKVGDLDSANACLESIIDNRQLNKNQDIFIYVRNK